ncbi:helix-turn-helix domain-containing protein [Lutimonas vermicola]|uniref:Helix-turn-helix domain-containing protein n=1 Tax=Lutimonas vermicola TaxID=414288 RepID=A0ABU9L4L0_9FLAO
MKVEFITKADLIEFKEEISESLTTSIKEFKPKKWLRSKEVRKMLGISPGTLQNFRINGLIPHTKIGGTLFYDYDEIIKVLKENKSVN